MFTRLELLKDTLEVASNNYEDNNRLIGDLDDKAQRLTAVAGVFLGFLLSVLKPDDLAKLKDRVGDQGLQLLTVAILFLIFSLVIALFATWVRRIKALLSLDHMTEMIKDLGDDPNLGTQDMEEAYNEQKIRFWSKCIENQTRVRSLKRDLVLAAQVVLAVAIIAVAYMLLVLIRMNK